MVEAVASEINRGSEVKKLLQTVSGVLALALMSASNAQTYPNKPVRFLVGFAAGGPTDVAMRTFASKMSEIWGQNLVVENHGGAGGIIAAEIATKAQTDGYTLLMCGLAHVISPALYKKLSFDHIRDFAPVSTIGTVPNILVVNNSLPATTVGEFISYAKANPGKINYGSSGVDARRRAKQFHGQVRRGPNARGAVIDLARICFCIADKFADGHHRQRVIHDQDVRNGADRRDRREVPDVIERQFLV